jgi:hypothetical protein
MYVAVISKSLQSLNTAVSIVYTLRLRERESRRGRERGIDRNRDRDIDRDRDRDNGRRPVHGALNVANDSIEY